MHTCIHTHHTHTHTHVRTYMYVHTHTHTQTYTTYTCIHAHTHSRGGYRGGPTHHTAMPLNPNVHSQSLLSLPMAPGNVRTTPIQQIGMVSLCAHAHTCTRMALDCPGAKIPDWVLSKCSWEYRLAENFRGRRLSRFGGNKIFAEKTFANCSLVSLPKDSMPPNLAEKTFANSSKTSKVVKVFCYMVPAMEVTLILTLGGTS